MIAIRSSRFDLDNIGEAENLAALRHPILRESHLPTPRVEAITPALLKSALIRAFLWDGFQTQ